MTLTVRTLNANGTTYVTLKTAKRDVQVLVLPGKTPAESLQAHAAKLRVEAARALATAELMEAGADVLLTPATV
jgi:hypothetical protein